jgi:hypothetical protein
MSTRKRLLMSGLAVVALMALVVGSVLAAPGPQSSEDNPGGKAATYRQFFIERLAGLLNVTPEQLREATKQAARETVDEAEEQGDIAANRASKLRERIERGLPGWGLGGVQRGMGCLKGGGLAMGHLQAIEAQAAALGMTPAELRASLAEGKTLAELAAERGITAEQMKAAVLGQIGERLDQAVAAGNLSDKQAQAMRERLNQVPAEHFLAGPRGVLKGFQVPRARSGPQA